MQHPLLESNAASSPKDAPGCGGPASSSPDAGGTVLVTCLLQATVMLTMPFAQDVKGLVRG